MGSREILIKIASYRDPELTKTIESALSTALHPENLRFAIVDQVGRETVGQLAPYRADPRFRMTEVEWPMSLGLGWARRMCDRMWRGEGFTLQIDSHMRFQAGWDAALINDIELTQDPYAIISCYPAVYYIDSGRDVLQNTHTHRIVCDAIDSAGVPELRAGENSAALAPVYLVAGGFQFSRGSVNVDVPNHENVFYGDESVQAVRLFTHGYNIYAPTRVPLHHLYERHKWMPVEYWSENVKTEAPTMLRHRKLYAASLSVVSRIRDLKDQAWVGSTRSKEEFAAEAGADLPPNFFFSTSRRRD